MTFIEKINARIVDKLTGGLGVTDIGKQLDSLLPEDREYALKHLPNHMAKAGRGEQLYRWLTDFHFIEAKVSALGAQPLIDDYTLGSNPDLSLSGEREKTLTLIQGAIRLSAHILERDKTQLAGQLLGRLLEPPQSAQKKEGQGGNPDIQAMLEQAKQWKGSPWLRPLTPNLTPPGGALLRTLTGHTSKVDNSRRFAIIRGSSLQFSHGLRPIAKSSRISWIAPKDSQEICR